MHVRQETPVIGIDWQTFSIGSGNAVVFEQPTSRSIAVNRVLGSSPSEIHGALRANGQVFLLNPNGVLFAPGASIDVAGLVASTGKLSDQQIIDRQFTLREHGLGAVVNQGHLRAADGGFVVLAGAIARNGGQIHAPGGKVVLAAADTVNLNIDNGRLMSVQVNGAVLKALAENHGLIVADGGGVFLTAKGRDTLLSTVVNQSGVIQARSLAQRSGRVYLDGEGGDVTHTGHIDASGGAGLRGGDVVLTGHRTGLFGNATLNVSGDVGGGTAKIGGGWQGQDQDVRNAQMTMLGAGARIDASAGEKGDGGTVVLWSDDFTAMDGTIRAEGGALGGSGGAVETSGRVALQVLGGVSTVAPNGAAGQWLLDPTDVTISADASIRISTGPDFVPNDRATRAVVSNTSIVDALNNGTAVTVTTASRGSSTGNLTISAPIDKTAGGDASLTIFANGSIFQQSNITSTSGRLSIKLTAATGYLINNGSLASNGGDLALSASGGMTGAIMRFNDGSALDWGAGNVSVQAINTLQGGLSFSGVVSLTGGADSQAGFFGKGANGSGVSFGSGTVDAAIGSAGLLTFTGFGGGTRAGIELNGTRQTISGNVAFEGHAAAGSSGPGLALTDARVDAAQGSRVVLTGNASAAATAGIGIASPGLSLGGAGSFILQGSARSSAGIAVGVPAWLDAARMSGGALQLFGQSDGAAGIDIGGVANWTTAAALSIEGTSSNGALPGLRLTAGRNAFTSTGGGSVSLAGLADVSVSDASVGVVIDNAAISATLGAGGNYSLATRATTGQLGNITLNGAIAKAGGGASALCMTASGHVWLHAAIGSAADSLAVTVAAENGTVSLHGAHLTTATGSVAVLAGALQTDNAVVQSDGGNIDIALSGANATLFNVRGATVIDSGTGNITIAASDSGSVIDTVRIHGADLVLRSQGAGATSLQVDRAGMPGIAGHASASYAALKISGNGGLHVTGNAALTLTTRVRGAGLALDGGALTVTGGALDVSAAVASPDTSASEGVYVIGNSVLSADDGSVTVNGVMPGNRGVSVGTINNVGFFDTALAIEGNGAVNLRSPQRMVFRASANQSSIISGGGSLNLSATDFSLTSGVSFNLPNLTVSSTKAGAGLALSHVQAVNLDVQSAGPLQQLAGTVLNVSGNTSLQVTGSTILSASANRLAGTLSMDIAGDVQIMNGQALLLGDSRVGGNASLAVTQGGISQRGALSTGGALHLSATGGALQDIALTDRGNAIGGLLTVGGASGGNWNSVAIRNGSDLFLGGLSAIEGHADISTFSGNLTVSANGSVGGSLTLAAGTDMALNPGQLNGAVSGGDVRVVGSPRLRAGIGGNVVIYSGNADSAMLSSLTGSDYVKAYRTLAWGGPVNASAPLQLFYRVAPNAVISGSFDRVYDGTPQAVLSGGSASGLIDGDTLDNAGFAYRFHDRRAGNGKTVAVDDALGYAIVNLSGNISRAELTISGLQAASKVYDASTVATLAGTQALTGVVSGDEVVLNGRATQGSFSDRHVGTGKAVIVDLSALAIDGADAGNYRLVGATEALAANITPAPLMIAAQSGSKVYDGTTSAAAPLVTGLFGDDAVVGLGQAFTSRHVLGSGQSTLRLTDGYRVSDGNGGANYQLTVSDTAPGTITPAALTIAAQGDSKVYDGTTTSAAAPVVTGLFVDDAVVGLGQAFTSRHVLGIGQSTLRLTDGYRVSDGNGGNNYQLTVSDTAPGTITPAALTLAAQNDNKVYDGTTASAVAPVVTGLIGDDAVRGLGQAFISRHVLGSGQSTLRPTDGYAISDGNGGNNYRVSLVSTAPGTIAPATLTIAAHGDSKVYDGTTASAAAPMVTGLFADDAVADLGQAFTSRHVLGIGQSTLRLTDGYRVSDGNGGNNYQLTVSDTTPGTITPAALTLAAQGDSKVYDGTTSSAVAPVVTGLFGDDAVADLGQAFTSRHVLGIGQSTLRLTDGYRVSDGNSGNNYQLTVSDTAPGTISPAALTIAAQGDSKVYDGTTTSAAAPVVTGLFVDDAVVGLGQAFASRHVLGAGQSTLHLTDGYAISDGNGGNNYQLTVSDTAPGTITPAALTLAAQGDSKVYDGTTTSAVAPVVTGLIGDDAVLGLGQAFISRHVLGSGQSTLRPTDGYAISDGNGGNNYRVSLVSTAPGTITPAALTLAAQGDSKVYDGTTTSAVAPVVTGLIGDDAVVGLGQAFTSRHVLGSGQSTLRLTDGYGISDGNGGANYQLTVSDTAPGTITPAALTLAAQGDSKVYDGTTSSAVAPVVTGLFVDDAVVGLGQAFASRHALGTGQSTLRLTDGYRVSDGNGGSNYQLTVSDTAPGTITPAALTLAAQGDSKVYDGTATSAVAPVVTGLIGDDAVVGLGQAYTSRHVLGSGQSILRLTDGYAISDGNGGSNYKLTVSDTAPGTITPAALTLAAQGDSKVYDGTTTSAVAPVVTGLFVDDVVVGLGQAFTSRHVLGIGQSTLRLTDGYRVSDGNGGGNYRLTVKDAAVGTITPAEISEVSGLRALNKMYDGTTMAELDTSAASFSGMIPGDRLSVGAVSGRFVDPDAGFEKPVRIDGVSLSGADATNYRLMATTGESSAAILLPPLAAIAVPRVTTTTSGAAPVAGVPAQPQVAEMLSGGNADTGGWSASAAVGTVAGDGALVAGGDNDSAKLDAAKPIVQAGQDERPEKQEKSEMAEKTEVETSLDDLIASCDIASCD